MVCVNKMYSNGLHFFVYKYSDRIFWYCVFISNAFQLVWDILIIHLLMYPTVHNLGRHCLCDIVCAAAILVYCEYIGLPITNLASSWCILANRERAAQPYYTNTRGINMVSSCKSTRNTERNLST